MGGVFQFAGLAYCAGTLLYYISIMSGISQATGQLSADAGELDRFMVGFVADHFRVQWMVWLAIHQAIGGAVLKFGRWMSEQDEAKRKALEAPVEPESAEVRDPLADLPDRKGNPFRKGDVSDIVIPRARYTGPTNVFRKTIERPNSDGY